MDESTLKGTVCGLARRRAPRSKLFRHEDVFSSGVPDVSFTGGRKTSWWEFKYARPKLRSREIQDLSMLELDEFGIAFYVVYYELKELRSTHVIRPRDLLVKIKTGITYADEWMKRGLVVPGFNHEFVVNQMIKVHS